MLLSWEISSFENRMKKGKEQKIIARMLEALNVPRDGVLFVHSSFKQFSRDGYDADAVLATLVDYMRPGTLLLPTMSWRYVNTGSPFFDELETPSNTGILTEKFRQQYAVCRSLHPTHSVAGMGRGAEEFLGGHHLDETPCSINSPFGKLSHDRAHVVMMGIGMDCCTLVHYVEEMIAPELYLRPVEEREMYTCRDRHGEERQVGLRRHLFLARDYWQYQDQLHADGKLKTFACDTSICRGFRAVDLVDLVTRSLQQKPDAIIARPGQRYRMM